MTLAPQVTLLGVALAFVFCGSMFVILWWMLHPPAHVSLSAAKARVAVSAIKKIIVPTIGTGYSERAVELACRLGEKQKAEIVVAHFIKIPFTLPLNASMESAETAAKEIVERGVEIVRHSNLPSRAVVERARQVEDGIIRLAREEDADLIVMGIRPVVGLPERIVGRTSEAVLHRAPCEVLIDRRAD
ncbi:MAG TPA: universal stress protein [Terriglobales bacterium]|nr:universal stress protein [Terriglobales bacterium]